MNRYLASARDLAIGAFVFAAAVMLSMSLLMIGAFWLQLPHVDEEGAMFMWVLGGALVGAKHPPSEANRL